MKKEIKQTRKLGRNKFLTALGGLLLIPFVSKAQAFEIKETTPEDEEYHILLRPDGTTVKVRKNNLKNSQTIKNSLNNKDLKSWLKK